jgi:predicted nucleic acid-binding protein
VTTYADSSALVPLYVNERFSETAESVLRRAGQIPFTVLHRLEVPNAFERLVGRDLMTRGECESVEQQVREDLESQRLVPLAVDLEEVFSQATELSRRYAAKYLARSLDLLHVAAAHAANCTTFVSADDRQLGVAKASGLRIIDIRRPHRRTR